MATIVNTPAQGTDSGSGFGLIMGLVLVILVLMVFFIYGLPALRQSAGNGGMGGGGAQIKVPDKVDVNVNQPK